LLIPTQPVTGWQGLLTTVAFASVLLLIAFDLAHPTLAAILGAALLVATGVVSLSRAVTFVAEAHATIALFFGGMVIVRVFAPTRIFEYLGMQVYRRSKGSGKRLIVGIIAVTAPICAFLPNATTVILLAPVIVQISEYFEIDFAPLLILLVFVANSAGLLTLVGDPASFLIGDAIRIGFVGFLKAASPGGVLAILALVAATPFLFRSIWTLQRNDQMTSEPPKILFPRAVAAGGLIIVLEVVLFVFGEYLSVPLYPAAVSLLGSALALAIAQQTHIDTIENILSDIDWSTLIFFMCAFVMVGAMADHGVMSHPARAMTVLFGQNVARATIALVFLVGALSALVPNIPLVVGMVPVVKAYSVTIGLAPASFMSAYSQALTGPALPLFLAMMFGATLGGNATMIGASSNMIAVGVSAQNGRRIKFPEFARYGIPVVAVQLAVSALYLAARFLLPGIWQR
jgi:Na+/H+ antiporter NhaD/arsenite permease-like protein